MAPPKRSARVDRAADEVKRLACDPSFNLLDKLSPPGTTPSNVATIGSSSQKEIDIKDISEGHCLGTVEGRIVGKSDKHEFKGLRPGSVFDFKLADNTAVIRVAVFSNGASNFDQLFKDLKLNAVIKMTRFRACKKKENVYNTTPHELEIFWQTTTTFEYVQDDGFYPAIGFSLIPFEKVLSSPVGTLIDVIGVTGKVGELQDVPSGPIRVVTLVDKTGARLDLTFWKHAAVNLDINQGGIVALKGGRVKNYLGVNSLNVDMQSVCWVDPDLPEAKILNDWVRSMLQN